MVPEIIIVVPPLLGLKGNLEMTLAARYVEGNIFDPLNVHNVGVLDGQNVNFDPSFNFEG